MATSQKHINQWKHNREFLATIPPRFPDWQVTVAFYVALQAIDALLALDGIHVTSHEGRNGALMRTNRYDKIFRAYHPLYNLSQTVRYLAEPQKWIPPHEVSETVLAKHLYPIEQSVQKLAKLNLDLEYPIKLMSA